VGRELDGADVASRESPLQVRRGMPVDDALVRWGPRVGVSSATQVPWRAWIDGDPTVSTYRPHIPKKRR